MDAQPPIQEWAPDELLGPLNDVEGRNAPPRLFTRGDTSFLREGARIAVVGSRKATPEAVRRAQKLVRYLVGHRALIVSGLAEGVDHAAHQAALERGGRTIAVVGTGLDLAYPAANAALQWRIAREHLLVSQFPVGTPIQRSNFPRRNRTMALIADATVIVEAGDTSGTLSQGWESLRLGRPLFIMRSVATSPALRWPAEMLGYGAIVLSEPDELLPLLDVRHGPAAAAAF
jgi:DNA processing protein